VQKRKKHVKNIYDFAVMEQTY